jgi:peroxiredoxin
MHKLQHSVAKSRIFIELLFFIVLITVGGYLFSRLVVRAFTAQNASDIVTIIPTIAPTSAIRNVQTDQVLSVTPNIQVTPINVESDDLFEAVLIGEIAPDFTLPTLTEDEITLSELRGQGVWINFWASWCEPCRVEMPLLTTAFERYHDDGLMILGLNLTEQDTLEAVNSFVNEFDITYPILLDYQGHVSSDSYKLLGLPMSVFVDRSGIVKRIVVGAVLETEVMSLVAEILGEVN